MDNRPLSLIELQNEETNVSSNPSQSNRSTSRSKVSSLSIPPVRIPSPFLQQYNQSPSNNSNKLSNKTQTISSAGSSSTKRSSVLSRLEVSTIRLRDDDVHTKDIPLTTNIRKRSTTPGPVSRPLSNTHTNSNTTPNRLLPEYNYTDPAIHMLMSGSKSSTGISPAVTTMRPVTPVHLSPSNTIHSATKPRSSSFSSTTSFASSGTRNTADLPRAYSGTLRLTDEEVNAVTTAHYVNSQHYVVTSRTKEGIPVLDPYLERLAVPRVPADQNDRRSVSRGRSRTNSITSVAQSINNGRSRTNSIGKTATPERRPWSPAGVSTRSRATTPTPSINPPKIAKSSPEVLRGPTHVTLHALTGSKFMEHISPTKISASLRNRTFHGPTQAAVIAAERTNPSPPGVSQVDRLAAWLIGQSSSTTANDINNDNITSVNLAQILSSGIKPESTLKSSDSKPSSSSTLTEQDILRSPSFRTAIVDAAFRSLMSSSSSANKHNLDNNQDDTLQYLQSHENDDLVTVTGSSHVLAANIPLPPPVFADSHRVPIPSKYLHPEEEPQLHSPSVLNDMLLSSTMRKSSERDQVAIPVPRVLPPSTSTMNSRRPWHPAGLATEPLPSLDDNDGLINNHNPLSMSVVSVSGNAHPRLSISTNHNDNTVSDEPNSTPTGITSPLSTTSTSSFNRINRKITDNVPSPSSHDLPHKFVAVSANETLNHMLRTKIKDNHHHPYHQPTTITDENTSVLSNPVRDRIEEAISRAIITTEQPLSSDTHSNIISSTTGAEIEPDNLDDIVNETSTSIQENTVELAANSNDNDAVIDADDNDNNTNISISTSIKSNTTLELGIVTLLAVLIGYTSSGGFLILSTILSVILGIIFAYFHQHRENKSNADNNNSKND